MLKRIFFVCLVCYLLIAGIYVYWINKTNLTYKNYAKEINATQQYQIQSSSLIANNNFNDYTIYQQLENQDVVKFELYSYPNKYVYKTNIKNKENIENFLSQNPKYNKFQTTSKDLYQVNSTYQELTLIPKLNIKLYLFDSIKDNNKTQHYYYHQTGCNNIEIYGSLLSLHVKPNGQIYGISGNLISTNLPDCIITISQKEAEKNVSDESKNSIDNVKFINKYIFIPRLVGIEDQSNYLIYAINSCDKNNQCVQYFVDTKSGTIKFKQPLYNQAMDRYVLRYGYGLPENEYIARTEGDPPSKDELVNRAYDLLGDTYYYYKTNFNRDAIDNKGGQLFAAIHALDVDNAYWEDAGKNFGGRIDLCTNSFNLAVVSHEYQHGVNQASVGERGFLIDPDYWTCYYGQQPGAIEEGLSNIFASAVINNWLIEYTYDRNNYYISLANPDLYMTPDRLFSIYFQCYITCAHHNSTVFGKAVYLMAEGGKFNNCDILGIGRKKAMAAVYQGLTKYMKGKTTGNFLDMYNAVNQGCIDLYGSDSSECINIKKAMQATEMDQQPFGEIKAASCLGIKAKPATCAPPAPTPKPKEPCIRDCTCDKPAICLKYPSCKGSGGRCILKNKRQGYCCYGESE